MASKHDDDWWAYNHAIDVLDEVRERLEAGANGSGCVLTAIECEKLLLGLRDPPRPRGRPPADKLEAATREGAIASHYRRLLAANMQPKNAVIDTMAAFDCSRSEVFRARKRSPKISSIFPDDFLADTGI